MALAIKIAFMKLRYKNLLKAVVASLLLAVTIYIPFRNSEGVPGNLFVVSILFHLMAIWVGIFAFFLRLFRLAPLPDTVEQFLDGLNNPGRFFYIFMGTLNCLIGVGAVILNIIGLANRNIITEFWPHLVLAVVLLSDSFIFSKEKKQSYI